MTLWKKAVGIGLPLLSNALEKGRFVRQSVETFLPNRRFRQAHPEFPVPPLYVLWDAQSYTSYARYREYGAATAEMYWQIFRTHAMTRSGSSAAPYRVLEWGCGPARIVRHLPSLAAADGVAAEFYGTDYNPASIAWARANLPEVQFVLNTLAPPLPFPDHHFDFLYCRSVFTHLSEAMHFAWIRELQRVVRPGGVISLSTQGAAHRLRLGMVERGRFDRGELVLRVLAAEGKLMYSAFHPPQFVRERLLAGLTVLQHDTPAATQEVWVVRRP
jgi:ubiquinone/menaquinone biosynthesis C-methylase UbiE